MIIRYASLLVKISVGIVNLGLYVVDKVCHGIQVFQFTWVHANVELTLNLIDQIRNPVGFQKPAFMAPKRIIQAQGVLVRVNKLR